MDVDSLFPVANSWLLILNFLLLALAIGFSAHGRYRPAVALLTLAALSLRFFMAHADPFLHEWDERFHALVARNMMDDPFMPMLRSNPIQPYDIRSWCCNHIWLHKQPLFLWQMALSMKLFGVSEFTIRYPSVIMGAMMIPLLFRTGYLAFGNKRTAFIAATLMCYCYYHLDLVAGYYGMDHNDIAFDFYVLASIWAFAEYRRKLEWKWALLIGFLAGCAVLNKWLAGLLVYAGWGLTILLSLRRKETRKEALQLCLSLLTCTAVFLPWQWYIFQRFPEEAAYEYAFNGRHLWEAVEGHGGTAWYYLDQFNDYFGDVIWLLIPAGLLLSLGLKKTRNPLSIALATLFLFTFVFFSFIARTKIHAYFMMVVPVGFLYLAYCLEYLGRIPRAGKYLYVPALLVCVLLSFKLSRITYEHDPRFNDWAARAHNTQVFRQLAQQLPPDVQAVSHMAPFRETELMFFNNHLDAYSIADLQLMRDKHIKVAFFKWPGQQDYAGDARQYSDAVFITDTLR